MSKKSPIKPLHLGADSGLMHFCLSDSDQPDAMTVVQILIDAGYSVTVSDDYDGSRHYYTIEYKYPDTKRGAETKDKKMN